MSVATAADESRDKAVDAIKEAIRELNHIVVDQCWGHEEYTAEYRAKLNSAFIALIGLRDDLT